ncbi:MAG TPA: serine protease [Dehalococcoidia bacterium]|nr:serine protease [Dehalococcoidia bacterium]
MNRLKLIACSAAIAIGLTLLACGGSGEKGQPADTPKPPRGPVETAEKTSGIDSLAASVVMVAPGAFDGGDFEPVATGSGTIVDESGLILTNFHVVDPEGVGAYEDIAIYVTDDPKESPTLTYFGGLAAWDKELDLAVVRITENRNGVEIDVEGLDLPVVSIGDVADLDIGETLTVLGYPAIGGGSLELTKGAVSGFLAAEGKKDAWIKTDARIAAGNSGGGAFDEDGDLVGIPTAIYYVEGLGVEESGRIRPIDLAAGLLRDARATTTVVIPQLEEPGAGGAGIDVPLLSEADFSPNFVLSWESYLTNEDRAAFYENPDEALSFYEDYGRIGGVRRVFDDFDSADAQGVTPTVIVVQTDLYETSQGAAGAVSDCSEFLDTMWEFVTDMGFEFYEPELVSDPQLGDESCLYGAEEDVGSSNESPLMLAFVGFRQANALIVVGVFSLTLDFDYQTVVALAGAQSNLLTRAGLPALSREPRAPVANEPLGWPTPEDAIAEYLWYYDIEYIGDCAYADATYDIGRYCSTAYEDRGGMVIYLAGATFSEYDSWFLTEQYADGSWAVADAIDLTYDMSGDLLPPPW